MRGAVDLYRARAKKRTFTDPFENVDLKMPGKCIGGAVDIVRHFNCGETVYASSSGPVEVGNPIWTAEILAVNKKADTYTVFFKADEETMTDVPWTWILHEGV